HHSSPYRHLSLLPSPRSCNLCPPPGNSHPFPTRRSSDLLLTDQGLRIFAGMETDIAEGGHILCMGVPEEILELNKRLEPHKEKEDRKSTRLNSSHVSISYAVFCLKKKKNCSNRVITYSRL